MNVFFVENLLSAVNLTSFFCIRVEIDPTESQDLNGSESDKKKTDGYTHGQKDRQSNRNQN